MNRDEIINIVKVKMDEVSPFEEEELVSSSLIEQLLDFAAGSVVRLFPDHQLPTITDNSISLTKNPDGSGYFTLPDSFQRLVSLRLESWERPVTKAITDKDPSYSIQFNKYIRGGVTFPVAVQKSRTMEYFSVPKEMSHELKEFTYIKEMKAEEIPDVLIDALTWECARLAFDSMQDTQSAAACTNNFVTLLKIAHEGTDNTRRE